MNVPSTQDTHTSYNGILFTGIALVILVVLALWGGRPEGGADLLFYGGVIVFGVVALGFGVAGWHLLFRPLPEGHAQPTSAILTDGQRRTIALLQTVAGLLMTVGGMWDEFWHRTYGLPFGEDFFWRPHLLMYVGFIVALLVGMWGWRLILTQGSGTLQQRFRADKIFGMLVLVGSFMIYALPADPLWHELYGNDLSAWSVPHVILAVVYIMVVMTAAGMQLSLVQPRQWRSVGEFELTDLVPLLSFVVMHAAIIMLLMTDWDNLTQRYDSIAAVLAGRGEEYAVALERPDWLLPSFAVFVSAALSVLANHALRMVGAASLMLALSLGFRFFMLGVIQPENVGPGGWYMTILPILAVDVWYALSIYGRERVPAWWTTALAATVGMALTLPLLSEIFIYPQVSLTNAPAMLLASVIAGAMAAWMGGIIGNYLAATSARHADEQPSTSAVTWVTPATFAAALAFMVWFIATATPPV